MGGTLASVTTSISLHDQNYCLWDKAQLLVIISGKLARDIFVDKERTLDSMVDSI